MSLQGRQETTFLQGFCIEFLLRFLSVMEGDLEVYVNSSPKHFWSECFVMGTETNLEYSMMTV